VNSKQKSRQLPNPTLSRNPDVLRGHDVAIASTLGLHLQSTLHKLGQGRASEWAQTGVIRHATYDGEKQTRRSHWRLHVRSHTQSELYKIIGTLRKQSMWTGCGRCRCRGRGRGLSSKLKLPALFLVSFGHTAGAGNLIARRREGRAAPVRAQGTVRPLG
jgi:hypothetical protein